MIEKINRQIEFEMVTIEELVSNGHMLRKIDKYIDFSFIYDKVAPYYCLNNGRPGIDPVRFFKMLLIGYLYGIKSERRLVEEISHNNAYRWFLGYKLTDPIPHHSVFSKNRQRRYKDSTIFQEIFEDLVFMAMEENMLNGKVLYTDSTHIKSNANNKKFRNIEVPTTPQDYVDELNEAVNQDRIEHDKKPLPKAEVKEETKTIKESTTDPDSGYMNRDRKPQGFYFLDHRTTDSLYNMITDIYITPGNVSDNTCYIDRLKYQINRFGFDVEAVGLDSGYNTAFICKELYDLGIFAAIGRRKAGGKKHFFKKNKFTYDEERDIWICPNNCTLKYYTTIREGSKEYKSSKEDCKKCPYFKQCVTNQNGTKSIRVHVWQEYKDWVKDNTNSVYGKEIYRRRKETIERSFANSKELHGYRYAKFRGIEKMKIQAYMTAIAQNIKKMTNIFCKRGGGGKNPIINYIFSEIIYYIYILELQIGKITLKNQIPKNYSSIFNELLKTA